MASESDDSLVEVLVLKLTWAQQVKRHAALLSHTYNSAVKGWAS